MTNRKTPEQLAEPKNKGGRAPTYSAEHKAAFFTQVLERMGHGEPLAQICRDAGSPGLTMVYEWIAADKELAGLIARAREAGFDMIAQEALAIADTPVEGVETEESGDGTKTKRGDMLGHRKLQVETRLKLLAKWDPKRYGDKLAIGGAADLPPVQSNVTLDPSDAYKAILGGKA